MSYPYYQSTGLFCNEKTVVCTPSYSRYKGERCNLKPDSSNSTFGRFDFQVHGDNGKEDHSASRRCIILNQWNRAGLKAGDKVTVKE